MTYRARLMAYRPATQPRMGLTVRTGGESVPPWYPQGLLSHGEWHHYSGLPDLITYPIRVAVSESFHSEIQHRARRIPVDR